VNAKRAIVTGAGGGIGRAVAARLLKDGYEVVAIDLRQEALARVADELGGGERFRPVVVDVGDAAALADALKDVGEVRSLVAGAGICRQARLDDPDTDQVWRDVMRANVDGVWSCFRTVGPALVEGGRAVVISSGLGKLGRAGYSAYTASKHAVLGIVKCLAQELAPRRITVNAVCPGWVATEMAEADLVRTAKQQGSTAEDVRRAALEGIPLRRFVEADEVAALTCWLLTDDAAAITGQAYNISCGEFFA
jgi:NAD(P)-dependent dehydrogenase (short-subunit alcohol dehydrogenase family)